MQNTEAIRHPITATRCVVSFFDSPSQTTWYFTKDMNWVKEADHPDILSCFDKDRDYVIRNARASKFPKGVSFLSSSFLSLSPSVSPVEFKKDVKGFWVIQDRYTEKWHRFSITFIFKGFFFSRDDEDNVPVPDFPETIAIDRVNELGQNLIWHFDKNEESFEAMIGRSKVHRFPTDEEEQEDDCPDTFEVEEFSIFDNNEIFDYFHLGEVAVMPEPAAEQTKEEKQ